MKDINENIYQNNQMVLTYEIIRDKIHIPRKGIKVNERSMHMADKNVDNNENKSEKECCCHASKHRTEKEYKDLMNRLSRIEGQVRGIKGMLEKDAYCPEILVQVSAVNAALNSFNKVLLANHIRTCVADDIRDGKDETIDELVKVLQQLMR